MYRHLQRMIVCLSTPLNVAVSLPCRLIIQALLPRSILYKQSFSHGCTYIIESVAVSCLFLFSVFFIPIESITQTPILLNFIDTASTSSRQLQYLFHARLTKPSNSVEHVDWIYQQYPNSLHHKYTTCLSASPSSPLPSPQRSFAWVRPVLAS